MIVTFQEEKSCTVSDAPVAETDGSPITKLLEDNRVNPLKTLREIKEDVRMAIAYCCMECELGPYLFAEKTGINRTTLYKWRQSAGLQKDEERIKHQKSILLTQEKIGLEDALIKGKQLIRNKLKEAVMERLKHCQFNRSKTAASLGMNRSGFHLLLNRLFTRDEIEKMERDAFYRE